jgi:hypothetical protein
MIGIGLDTVNNGDGVADQYFGDFGILSAEQSCLKEAVPKKNAEVPRVTVVAAAEKRKGSGQSRLVRSKLSVALCEAEVVPMTVCLITANRTADHSSGES